MIALRAYEKFFKSSLDQLLDGNDGTIKPYSVVKKLMELENAVASMELYRMDDQFLQKQHLSQFDLRHRSRNGSITSLEMIHCSSGSSSKNGPTFWGRDITEELAVAVRFEQIFRDNFFAHERNTLAVNCFPMGSWVGGVFTAFCTRYLSQKGYLISQITPGNNPEEIIRISTGLFAQFDQVVFMGYPPFVKMIIDKGNSISSNYWKAYHPKFIFAGEVFSEEWRCLIASRAGVDDLERDIVSIYGTADAGVLANETVLSVKLRRFFASHPRLSKQIFKLDRIPSIMQYDPMTRYLEIKPDDQTLAVSGLPWSLAGESDENAAKRIPLPLKKYAIGDDGGIMDFDKMIAFATMNKSIDSPYIDEINQLLKTGNVRKLPFVWVFGRKFWTVSLYGANVFVENVMVGLEQPKISDFVTGKFVLAVSDDPEDCRLLIRIELVNDRIPENFKETSAIVIRDQIRRLNSEYSNYVPDEKQLPIISLHPLGDIPYFRPGMASSNQSTDANAIEVSSFQKYAIGGGVAIAGIVGLLVFAILKRRNSKTTEQTVDSSVGKLEEGFAGAKVHKPTRPLRKEKGNKVDSKKTNIPDNSKTEKVIS